MVWEWTGEGGTHNVVAEDGPFESETVDGDGHTFEHTFDAVGTYRYVCTPHRSLGMKGAVVVGDGGDSGGSAGGTGEGGTGNESAAGGSGGGGTGGGDTAVGELLTGLLAGAVLTMLFLLPVSELRSQRTDQQ